ncbi:MAG TPA: aromatic ring-hydroxylating dioxygenase subunit alpha [Burkholderiaceae bacterium]|jgi:choline monooxygenase|nr:aromatic ring-hydroxylating dioxygenase subunit alpha [Burkholderiaceae bacterium]
MSIAQRAFNPTDPGLSYTLPSDYYTSPEIYRKELQSVFARSWNLACHRTQVAEPGQYVKCKAGEEEVIVTRDRSGTLRGFYNVCMHRAHTLIQDDRGQTNVITCPYHAWTYHLDGSLRKARNCEGVEGFRKEDFSLNAVKVEEYCGFIFVNLDPEARPLASQAVGLEERLLKHCPDLKRLKFAHRLSWDVHCNWKTAIENFCECYHCAPAHRGFVDLVNMSGYSLTTHDTWSIHVGPPGDAAKSPYKYTATDDRPQDYIAIFLWPNISIWIMPGAGNISMLTMLPTGPETCTEHMDFFFMDETPTKEEWDSIVYLRDVLQPEDIGLCEKVQKGLRSRSYRTGRLVVDRERTGISEHAVHHFQCLVQRALSAA